MLMKRRNSSKGFKGKNKRQLAENYATRLRQKEADELLALCDAAAEMWEGEFGAAEDIRQMRRERDEQIWAIKP